MTGARRTPGRSLAAAATVVALLGAALGAGPPVPSGIGLVAPALAAAGKPAPGTPSPSVIKIVPEIRAMWLWSAADPAAVVDWARANAVKEIFAHVRLDTSVTPWQVPPAELARLAELRSRADSAGVQLAALGGDPSWVEDPSTALSWQRTVLATGLFRASHVDVEPYLLAAWNTSRTAVVDRYLSLLATLQVDDSRPLEADVAFWYSTIGVAGGGNLADAVLDRVSGVTVMSYRDTATGTNSIMAVGLDMLQRGIAKQKPVRLAAETGAQPDCRYCTFFEEGAKKMRATLRSVDSAANRYPSFVGIAVHHYDGWRALAS